MDERTSHYVAGVACIWLDVLHMNTQEPYSLYSNNAFLVPFATAIVRRNMLAAVIIGVMIVFSILFHATKTIGPVWWLSPDGRTVGQSVLLWLDTMGAHAVIIYNFYLFYKAGWPVLFWIALVIACLSFVPFWMPEVFGHYDEFHAVWHIVGAIVTVLALAA